MHSSKYFIKEEEKIKEKFNAVSKVIGEKGKRIWAAAEANSLGFGGISAVSRATGLDHKTIRKGIKELHKNAAILNSKYFHNFHISFYKKLQHQKHTIFDLEARLS